MSLKRCFLWLLCGLFLSWLSPCSAYASLATPSAVSQAPHPEPPTWKEAVEAVRASRAATSSEADLMALELNDEDYGISTLSSVGTVENTVDYSDARMAIIVTDNKTGKTFYKFAPVASDGSFNFDLSDSDYTVNRLLFRLYKGSLPSASKYLVSFDFASHISTEYRSAYYYSVRDTNNASSQVVSGDISFRQSSGDIYVSPFVVNLGSLTRFELCFYTDFSSQKFGGNFRFRFVPYNGSDVGVDTAGTGAGDSAADYQAGVSSGLSSIGDTLEEIVETISLQLEALWNQMYNYIHLPEYQKLEEIRQAIENIRLDVDVDNTGVINKLDEQIKNDNSNTTKVEQAVEKHGSFIIEGLKSLFIPSDEYFSALFDRLHIFFSERLGFLYVPFDLFIRLLNAFMNADTAFAGIPFPGIRAGEWVLLEPTVVTFSILDEFPELVELMHFATSSVMVVAFLKLLRDKMNEVLSR